MAARKPKSPRELAARALCTFYGLPENTKCDGLPMWRRYLPEVDVVLKAVEWPGLEEQREKDWQAREEARKGS